MELTGDGLVRDIEARAQAAGLTIAEVAIPRRLFAEILRLIDGLRPQLAPT